jgi:hypothetical protein
MSRTMTVLTLMVALTACGGGGGSSPSSPAAVPAPAPTPPPAFSVVHGLSGQLLAPQSVTPEDPNPGQSVAVVLDGFLTREQPWNGAPVALWPSRNEVEAAHIADLVYGLGRRPLMKWTTMDVEAILEVIGDDWAEDVPEVRAAFERGFAEIAAAGGPRFSWAASGGTPGLDVPGGPGLRIVVDRYTECLEGDEYVACGELGRDGSTITRAELVFDSPRTARDRLVTMRMLAQAIGLSGTDVHGAVTTWSYYNRGHQFHELETTALWMMYMHRNPGNLLPDRDPGFASSRADGGWERLVDRGPGRRP